MEMRKHFVLVHGACHGAWCWYKLVTLLKTAGHHVTALDLGGSGVDPKPLEEITSISDYLQPFMELMASLPQQEKVILIGHSYGGLPISLAMERFPEKISVAVFLAAYMPHYKSPPAILIQEYFKGIQVESLMDCQFTFNQGTEKPPSSTLFGSEFMKDKAYRHCHPEAIFQLLNLSRDLELAKLLLRPSGLFFDDWSKENMLTEVKYGSVNRVFVLTEEDEVVKGEFQMWMIENYPAREVKSIPKSGHMVMLSKPNELFLVLQELAHN